MSQTDELAGWRRHGRGRELQFFATDDEMLDYLGSAPPDLGPYDIVGTRLVREGKEYARRMFAMTIAEYGAALSERAAPNQFFLRSRTLAPELPSDPIEMDRRFGLCGAVVVQHGFRRGDKRDASRISVVTSIVSDATGAVRRLSEQERLFEALRKRIRKDLRYLSIQVLADGTEIEDDLAKMTEAAAEEGRRGELTRRPGRLVASSARRDGRR
jgi:hypothetical protein